MKKEEFLKSLREELIKYKVSDAENIIEYYDELIEDKKESKKHKLTEEEIIVQLASVSDITREVLIDQKLEVASQKPTISNGIKALIAFLSVLSLPLLLPLVVVVIVLGIAALILLGSFVIVAGALVFSFGAGIFGLFFYLFAGQLPIASFLFGLGVLLVCFGLSLLLLKWLGSVTRQLTLAFVEMLKDKVKKRKGAKQNG